jgi:hypothetical protein
MVRNSSKRFGILAPGKRNTATDAAMVDQAGCEGAEAFALSARPADSTASAERIASPKRIGP